MIFGFQTHAFEDTVVKENHKKSWSLRSQQISALSCTGMTDPSFLKVVLEKVPQNLPNSIFALNPFLICTPAHYICRSQSQEDAALKSWQHQEFLQEFQERWWSHDPINIRREYQAGWITIIFLHLCHFYVLTIITITPKVENSPLS